MTDYERGVEQASNSYREVIREYVAENAKLRELVVWMYRLMDESCAVQHPYTPEPIRYDTLLDVYEKLRELHLTSQ